MAQKKNVGKPGTRSRNPFGVVGDAADGRYNPPKPKPKMAPAPRQSSSASQQASRQARERAIVASDKVPARRTVARVKTGGRTASDPWANENLFRRAVNDARSGRH